MTVQYIGSKAGAFIRRDYTRIVNGSRASGNLVGGVARNQTWLAYEDPGAVNFYSGPQVQIASDGTSTLGWVLVEVPPGCTEVEFHFLATRQEVPEPYPGPLYPGEIIVESSIEARSIHVEALPGLKNPPSILSASWYTTSGLTVRSTPDPLRTDAWVEVKTSAPMPGVHIFSAYYRCVPPRESIPYDDLE